MHPEILRVGAEAMALPPEAIDPILARASLRLRALFRTSERVVMHPGSADLLREMVWRVAVEYRALVLIAGPEGEALASRLEALGKEVIRVVVSRGRSVEPAHLARFLEGPPVDSVALVHAEAGTGVLAPLAEMAEVVRAHPDLLLLVDAGGSVGASPLETRAWGLDAVIASSEGPLGLPAGVAFAALSQRLVDRVRRQSARGTELDLLLHWDAAARGQMVGAIAPALAAMLGHQLERVFEEEGLVRRWLRHAEMRQMVEEWALQRPGVTALAAGERRAHAFTCLELERPGSAASLLASLDEAGWRIAPGLGEGVERQIRIGHMGDMRPRHLASLLEALGRVVEG